MTRDALVVGINNYQDDGLHNLNAPAEDALVQLFMPEGK